MPGASKAIGAIVAGPSLVAALCLAGALAAFLVYPAYAQSGDEASAPSNLTAAIADGGVILNWSSPVQDAASVTGYEILRRRPTEGEGALLVLVADTDSTATTYVDATANEQGTQYVYRVKALRGSEKSSRSNYTRVDLPEEADETGPTPAPAPRDVTVHTSDAQSGDPCPGGDYDPTPTEIAVSSVPIEVSSTTSDYFVLYANVGGNDIPVQVKRGESGTTTLEENIKALPASDYRVEKYAVAAPADVDLDCLDDLADPSPLNHSHRLELDPEDGAMMIANRAHFEELANAGVVKFVLVELGSSTPEIYFQNTEKYFRHTEFAAHLGIDDGNTIWAPAEIKYDSNILLNGYEGVYYYTLNRNYTSSEIERIHTLLAANLPVVDHNLAYSPWWVYGLPSDWVHDEDPRILVVDEGIIFRDVSYSALNAGEGYGRLQVLEPDDRPNPRDIVLYETLPNELSRVAGIISTQPQTPLSHVDLRAKQNKIPNAFIRDALDDAEISSLVGQYVYYRVTENAFELREATKAEVDFHYESLRPRARQIPERDLSVQAITPLSEIGFEDYDAFGVKAANVAELGKLDFPEGTVPDGFAIPFYFYDEFMKHNDFYNEVDALLADEDFLTDYDEQEKELKKLRGKIKKGESPEWMIEALEAMHGTYPEGQSLRYRSSTNNEDLPNFSGAGLYDSNTQKPEETEEDGIDKSMKQVFASLWNFRAFVEREFYRIDHKKTAMGILVHPNYTDELVNGVAVSFDPLYSKAGHHYVNSQVGEDLVTNPEAYSLPEGLLLKPDGSYVILHYSNQGERMRLLMSDSQVRQLRRHLDSIHDHFEGLYQPGPDEPFAMEIEFKITSTNVLAIKQARPWVFGGATPPSPDKAGTVALPSTQPQVGAVLTATLTDPDGSISNITWQWASSPNGSSNWATISGAASARYTPVDGDVGNYLRAMASYTDGHGAGKSAQAVTANPVEDAPPPPPPPLSPPPPPLITGVIGGAVPSGGGGGGGGAPAQDPSLIVLSPTSLSFEAAQGGDNPTPQTLRVWNAEEREMAFGTSENAPWLSRTPSAGISDGPDDAVRITLSVDVSGLEPGSYSATVRISGRRIGNSSQRVPVTLTVRPPGYARERVSPGERTEIVTPDSTLRLIVPENAASAEVDIELEKLDPASQTSPPGEQERVILAVDLQTLAPGSETSQPITFSPGAELRLLLPEHEEASCDAGRVRVYRVDAGEWELLEHRCETDDNDRVWAVSVLTSFSTFVLTVDDAAYPTGSICWSVANILSWTTSKTSGSQAAANTLLVWLEGVLRLWLSLSCR